MNNTLVLMCGAPGSGKTTIAKKLMCNNDLYISRDEIRYSMISDEDEYFSKEHNLNLFSNEIFSSAIQKKKKFLMNILNKLMRL